MHLHASPLAFILVFFSTLALAEEPGSPRVDNAPLRWSGKNGKTLTGRFVRMSGDSVVVESDGKEVPLSIHNMTEESARQARNLAGLDEPPVARVSTKPLQMRFLKIGTSRLQTEGISSARIGRIEKKYEFMRFEMGSSADEPGRDDNEPAHMVRLSRDFLLKDTEVTWAEWKSVRDQAGNRGYIDLSPGTNGQGGDASGNHPVLGITWWDAIKWCNLASQLQGLTPVYYTQQVFDVKFILMTGTPTPYANWDADGYRLPTEAEWEFACRAGTSGRAFHTGKIRSKETGSPDPNLDAAGWFEGNSAGSTHPAGGKKPNNFGLSDMHGNAAEWCWDIYAPLSPEEVTDPRGDDTGDQRVVRGGSWSDLSKACRAASRSGRHPAAMPNPSVGFRPAMKVPEQKAK